MKREQYEQLRDEGKLENDKIYIVDDDWMDDEAYYLEECAKLKAKNKELVKKCNLLEKKLDLCLDALYQYIKIYGVESKCSEFLKKYCKEAK